MSLYYFILLALYFAGCGHALRDTWCPLLKTCQTPCGSSSEIFGACSPDCDEFLQLGLAQPQVTDKVNPHLYQLMYGLFLYPLRRSSPFRFFEIGLGCEQAYGVGASAKLWRRLLPGTEIWEVDKNSECLKAHADTLRDLRLNSVAGDQGNTSHVWGWIHQSGGQFDVVVDDGCHANHVILLAFALLWGEVVPGGLYFMEDLQVGRRGNFDYTGGRMVVSDVLQMWLEELVVGFPSCDTPGMESVGDLGQYALWRLPRRTQWLFCQPEACVLRKAPAARGPALPLLAPASSHLLATLLRPAQNASADFHPQVLLHALPCVAQAPAVRHWQALLPRASLWLLNPETGCRGRGFGAAAPIQIKQVHKTLQALTSWVEGLDIRFDVVVDGSNGTDVQVLETHGALWPALKGSGLYVLPPLRGRSPAAHPITVVAVLQTWLDGLLLGTQKYAPASRPALPSGRNPWALPADLLFLSCEGGACVLGRWAAAPRSHVAYVAAADMQAWVNLPFAPESRCHPAQSQAQSR